MYKNSIGILVCLLLFVWNTSSAQFHIPLYPGLSGNALEIQLQTDFKPAIVLGYSTARDTLYAKIEARNDSLYCVYSGHNLYLDPNQDPTEYVYLAGSANGINAEHTYPRSKGAALEPALSDMHNLFPTRTAVNGDRGSFPFGEVVDAQANQWYYLTQEISSIPNGATIDLYSELGNGIFEPREDHKGNVARAMFYFYTMYRSQANNADASFFAQQRATLCDWHLLDPVDQREWNRNNKIASYQDGKRNPFILDCTLAFRTYCSEFAECMPTSSVQSPEDKVYRLSQNQPNPFSNTTEIQYTLAEKFQVRLSLHNLLGQEIATLVEATQNPGEYRLRWEKNATVDLPGGIIFYKLVLSNGNHNITQVRKMLVLP